MISRTLIRDHGFCVHSVVSPSGLVSHHTHGFLETWGHPDLEIALFVHRETAEDLLWAVADEVAAGRVFEEGQFDDVVLGLPCRFVERPRGGRSVLRLILPDPAGLFPEDPRCHEDYRDQESVRS